jgi:hypothetical protein
MQENDRMNSITTAAGVASRSQGVIVAPKISAVAGKDLDLKAAMALYMSASPFTLFMQPAMETFLKTLNPAYKIPERRQFSGQLLDEAYNRVKTQVDRVLKDNGLLNLIVDESTDIATHTIMNLSVHTQNGVFHYASESIGDERRTANATMTWIVARMLDLTQGRLERVNSLAADTCATMNAVGNMLNGKENTKHILFVPCDAHGLQLVVKDLLEKCPTLCALHQKAQDVATAFKTSPLQYARLREHQKRSYNRCYALVLAVITRWGTQYRLISSLIRSKDALRAYALDTSRNDKDLRNNAVATLRDRSFWTGLDILRDVLEPIDESLRMSESSRAHLGTVMGRWITINLHLERQGNHLPELQTFRLECFGPRFQRQTNDMHWAAHYLMPANVGATMDQVAQRRVFQFFNSQLNDNNKAAIRSDFISFRTKSGLFGPTMDCWDHCDDALLFWQIQATFVPRLGQIAIRLFSTPANSVPSERSFSAQNLIHDKKCNTLDPTRVNKLIFIHMNQRCLDNVKSGHNAAQWNQNDDELRLESEILPLADIGSLETAINLVDEAHTTAGLQDARLPVVPLHTELSDGLQRMMAG